MPSILHRDAARPRLALDSRRPHEIADKCRARRHREASGCRLGKRVDARMRCEQRLVESPDVAKPVVPQIEPTVGREHADGFEQIVEGRRADTKQGIARCRQLELLGPVLENHQQSAIGHRLGQHAQMRSVGKQPILLGAVCGLEPLPSFDLPGGKVACFGQAPGLAHPVEHTVEFRPLRQPFWAHREDRLERHVAECQRSIGGELRDPRRQAIERFALCIDKSPGVGPGALELVIVERIASDTRIAHGHVDDAHRATLATDRCRHIARHRLTGITRSDRCRDRRHPAERFDKLHSPPDDIGSVGGIDGLDIGAIDKREP